MRQKLIAGNWKMNGSRSSIDLLVRELAKAKSLPQNVDFLVCPPFPYVQEVQDLLAHSGFSIGAQNVSSALKGAYTGEVSVAMLLDFDVKYVICGHSERRELYGEDDTVVAQKAGICLDHGLTPIICVGETRVDHTRKQAPVFIGRQVDAVIAHLGQDKFDQIVFAYEPVWAIGTGLTATPAVAEEVHAFIRNRVAEVNPQQAANMRIIYGGSMRPNNAAQLLAEPNIDGGLIGGASLVAEDFLTICRLAGD